MTKTRIYIAAAWESRDRLVPVRDVINALPGYEVTSGWLGEPDSVGPDEGEGSPAERDQALADRDMGEIESSDMLIVDTVVTNDRGGKDFEAGYAAALGLIVWLVGPRRNVFHSLFPEYFATWEEALVALQAR